MIMVHIRQPFNFVTKLNGFFIVMKLLISLRFCYTYSRSETSVSERCVYMKRKMNLREFFRRKKIAAGCVAAAAVITAGSLAVVWQNSDVPELPSYTDPVVETTLTGDDTPLAPKPKVTTKTTSKTKTSKKNVKLKSAAKKTYTKSLPTTRKTKTSTKKTNKTTTVKTQTTVKTATTEKYTKKSKNKVVTQKVTTTVKTTTTVTAAATSTAGKTTASTAKQEKHTVSVSAIAPKMDGRVLNAYTKMGFTVTVDPSVPYAGYFDARTQSITLQAEDETIYHELGHFLAFIAGNVDRSSSFAAVYNSEKSKYTAVNKAYATQNASEYFAESVRNYILDPQMLRSQRPETYAAVEDALSKVTDDKVDKIIRLYSPIWK